MSPSDTGVVTRQLGREPRGRWRVAGRCPHGAPTVIAVAPLLEDGDPFPTLLWLTCPVAVRALSAAESAGEHADWTARAAHDPVLADALRTTAESYRAARAAEAGGTDPCHAGGVGGERDPLRVKCLHARAASALAGLDDPVGKHYLAALNEATARCDGRPCAADAGASAGAQRHAEGADQ